MHTEKLVSLLLRIGIAAVFLYAAIASTLQPLNWVGYFPEFVRNAAPVTIILPLFSLGQLILVFWLLSGKRTYFAAIIASITLALIIIANVRIFDIVFRDVAIFCAAVALACLSKNQSA